MWNRILKRTGRSIISVVVAGIVATTQESQYGLLLIPVLQAIGKWMRERGFQNVPV